MGGVLSTITTERLQVAVLPQSSVAVHVLVVVNDPGQVPGVDESENVIATVPSHESVAVGATHAGVAGQLIGVVWVAHVIVGGVTSCTTIERLQVAVLPQSSVAVHVLVAVKVPGQLPGVEESEKVIATVASQASVADAAAHVGVAGQLIGVVCVTHVIVGGVLSNTTIELLHVAVLPQSSVAVHVLVAV